MERLRGGEEEREEQYAKLAEEIEDKCLKKSGHGATKDAIYEVSHPHPPLTSQWDSSTAIDLVI